MTKSNCLIADHSDAGNRSLIDVIQGWGNDNDMLFTHSEAADLADRIQHIRQHTAPPDVCQGEISDDLHNELVGLISKTLSCDSYTAATVVTVIKPYLRTSEPVSVSQIAEKVNPCDEEDMEFYKDHVRTVLDAAGVKYVD